MAVKKTQMYRRNLDGTETNLNPLTESQYVLMENGQTVQEVLSDRDSDKYTPVITNSSSTFKVGQGDNVDLSSSMKEGAYDSCVLKGKTMVNCIQEPSSKDVVLPYGFTDGRYVTINDTKESGALGVELKGQTLVNLCQNLGNETSTSTSMLISGEISVKTNTTYMVVAKVKSSNPLSSISLSSFLRVDSITTGHILGGVTGDITTAYTTKSFTFNTGNTTTVKINLRNAYNDWGLTQNTAYTKEVILIEYQEGMENWDIPHFEGMTSCKMPILHTVGSLFDAQQIIPNNTFTYSHSTNTGRFEFTNRGDVVANTNIQLPAGTYDISFLVRGVCDNGRVAITFAKDGEAWHGCSRIEVYYGHFGSTTFKEVKSTRTFDAPVTVTLVGHAWAGGETGSGWCELKDIRFTPVGKTSILSLPEEVVLRSLPNGVCDTFNTRTGVYTQNVKEVTFNGSENWIKGVRSDTTVVSMFYLQLEDLLTNAEGDINDLFIDKIFTSQSHAIWNRDVEGIHNKRSCLYININNSRMSDVTIEAFKTWLSQNSITVQYQLVEPIVTKISLPSTLKSWNTTTHIYSEIPENTLYPILSHSNPTYPVILKPSTKYSIVANSYRNDHTNSAINFNLGGATTSTVVGNRVTTITTPSTLSNELLTMSGRGNKLNNVMVIEGDVVGDEPYFEGICDCKSPILSNCGENLFDIKNATKRYSSKSSLLNNGDGSVSVVGDGDGNGEGILVFSCCVYLKEGETYFFSFESDGQYSKVNGSDTVEAMLLRNASASDTIIGMTGFANTFVCPRSGDYYLRFDVNKNNVTHKFWNVYLAQVSTDSPYEPYKSNTTTFEQKDGKTIVLRSLPSGVCDTLNVETGEYVQRIGEVVLDGSRGVPSQELNGYFISYYGLDDVKKENGGNVYCDKFASHGQIWAGGREGVSTFSNGTIWLSISIDKLKTPNIDGMKAWLSQNPVTVQYELTTPIISTIDVQGFPYAYTNGHVQLSSGRSGQSLTPKVEYSLSANKTGQINSNTKRVSAHQKQLDDFEAMMLTSMVQSAYDKAILQFDYEMRMMSLGGE